MLHKRLLKINGKTPFSGYISLKKFLKKKKKKAEVFRDLRFGS